MPYIVEGFSRDWNGIIPLEMITGMEDRVPTLMIRHRQVIHVVDEMLPIPDFDRELDFTEPFEDAQYNDGYKAAPLVNIPTLIVHGNADESVAIEQSIKTSGLIPNCRLRVIRGADHTYTNPEHKKIMSAAIADYIKKHC